MHRGSAGLERDGGRVEGRGGAADHRYRFAAKHREIDIVRGVSVKRTRQTLAQHRWDIGAAIAGDAIGQDDLARLLNFASAVAFEMQAEMPIARLDPVEPGLVADFDPENAPVPAQILGPGLARN